MYTGFTSISDEISIAAVLSWKHGFISIRSEDPAHIDYIVNLSRLGKPPILTLESDELIITAPGTVVETFNPNGPGRLIHMEFFSPLTGYGISIECDGETYVTVRTVEGIRPIQ